MSGNPAGPSSSDHPALRPRWGDAKSRRDANSRWGGRVPPYNLSTGYRCKLKLSIKPYQANFRNKFTKSNANSVLGRKGMHVIYSIPFKNLSKSNMKIEQNQCAV